VERKKKDDECGLFCVRFLHFRALGGTFASVIYTCEVMMQVLIQAWIDLCPVTL